MFSASVQLNRDELVVVENMATAGCAGTQRFLVSNIQVDLLCIIGTAER